LKKGGEKRVSRGIMVMRKLTPLYLRGKGDKVKSGRKGVANLLKVEEGLINLQRGRRKERDAEG